MLFHQRNAALNAIVRQINRKTCPGLLLKQFAEIIAGNAELLRNLADRQLVEERVELWHDGDEAART